MNILAKIQKLATWLGALRLCSANPNRQSLAFHQNQHCLNMYPGPIINIRGGTGGSGGEGGAMGGPGGTGQGPQVQIYNTTSFQSHRRIIDALHCAKGVGPFASKTCLPDTRVSLLSRIRDWALDSTSGRTLLLHGAAGTGKSAIANTIARQLQHDGLAIVPFFAFNRSVLDRSSSQLIPTWAKHIADLNPQYLRYLETLPSHSLESSDILDQHDHLLVAGLAHAIYCGKPLIFTIDALDECPTSEAAQLFQVLRKVLSGLNLPSLVRFFFTYRSDEEILQTFEGLSSLKIPLDSEEGTVEDIHKFVYAQLHHNHHFADMVDDVTKAAQTLFECAAALCRELTTTRRPTSTSKRREFVRRLREGPVLSLYDSYHAILRMYFGEEDEQSDMVQILYWLGSLLSGTTLDNDPISPLHTSLRDFLLDTTKSGIFSVDLGPDSQEELSLACLKIMNCDLCFNICGLSTSFALNSEVEDLLHKEQWCNSTDLICKPPSVVLKEVQYFLKYQFLFWLEAHSCMQTLQDGPGTMLPMFLEWAMTVVFA
ncbi:hypothetical protein B0H14DRAFT_2658411 [Mycena olivaceomarginata]|nr:hypothetical protein B0H14DRAFT_2658411 [Mycena olivaceomarginata]